eukprot:2525370-Prymnesium_polylepis.2
MPTPPAPQSTPALIKSALPSSPQCSSPHPSQPKTCAPYPTLTAQRSCAAGKTYGTDCEQNDVPRLTGAP